MKFISYNVITEDLSISSSSINLQYSYPNLFDSYGSQVVKFTGYTDEWIMFDSGSGNTIDFDSIGFVNHNIDPGATITIMGNSTDSWTTPAYSQVLTWSELVIFAELNEFSYRYLRIRIQNSVIDPIQIGIIQAGEAFEIPNILADISTDELLSESAFISGSGNSDSSINYTGRSFDLAARDVTEEIKQQFIDIIRLIGRGSPVIGAIWESNFSLEKPLYFIFSALGKPKKNHYKWDFTFSITEVF